MVAAQKYVQFVLLRFDSSTGWRVSSSLLRISWDEQEINLLEITSGYSLDESSSGKTKKLSMTYHNSREVLT